MAQRIQVTGHAGHQIAGTVGTVKGHILPLDLVIENITHFIERTLGYMLIRHTVQIYQKRTQQGKTHHRSQKLIEQILFGRNIGCRIFAA